MRWADAALLQQRNGRLIGLEVDKVGAPIAGAALNMFLAGGASPLLPSNAASDGIFAFSAVRPDTYDLEVIAPGFAKYVSRGVKVDPTRETGLGTITLEVQSTRRTVEVSAINQGVQVSNAEVSTTVTQRQIQNLPVLDRQISALFLTQAGVSLSRGNTVINGMHTSFANVTLDGINIQDNFIRSNSLDYIPNKTTIEHVAQISITTPTAHSATGGGGAQIVISTPSGSNSYHGSLYWYNRNSFLGANDWFNNKSGVAPPVHEQNP